MQRERDTHAHTHTHTHDMHIYSIYSSTNLFIHMQAVATRLFAYIIMHVFRTGPVVFSSVSQDRMTCGGGEAYTRLMFRDPKKESQIVQALCGCSFSSGALPSKPLAWEETAREPGLATQDCTCFEPRLQFLSVGTFLCTEVSSPFLNVSCF